MSRSETEVKVLVVGFGSPIRGDDAVGWLAGERLEHELDARTARVVVCHQLLPELAEQISEAELVIFIDACCNRPAGQWGFEAVEPASAARRGIGHDCDAGELLAMARRLFHRCPPAVMLSVGVRSFDFGCELSPPVRRALQQVVACVRGEVDRYLAGDAGPSHLSACGVRRA